MNELLTTSFLWRTVTAAAAWLRRSALGRGIAALGRLWRQSFFYGLFARLLCRDAATEKSALRRGLDRCNVALCRFGQKIMPAIRGSLLYRAYGGLFRLGRESFDYKAYRTGKENTEDIGA